MENEQLLDNHDDGVDYIPFLPCYDFPKNKIHLYHLEELVNDRLLVLFCVRGLTRLTSLTFSEKRAKLIGLLQQHKLDHYVWLLTHNGIDPGTEEHRKHLEEEKLAHIYLHAVFAHKPAITDILLQQEKVLFTWQTISYEIPQVLEFLKRNEMTFPEATLGEKEALQHELDIYCGSGELRYSSATIYKVPWLSAADALERGEVLLHAGTCYVPQSKLKDVLPTLFNKHLQNEKKIELYKLVATVVLTRDQLIFLRSSLVSTFHNHHRYTRDLQFDIKNLDRDISSFPPCIRTIIDSWYSTRELKYQSRKQLWRFFRGLRTNVEPLLRHMRTIFKDPAKIKEYEYELKHTFGLVGGKYKYETPDCSAYNHGPTRAGEVDGCPFANCGSGDIEDLGKRMTKWNIPDKAQLDIFEHKANSHASKACGAFFTATLGVAPKHEILNPLDFYGESMEALNMNTGTDLKGEELDFEFLDKLFRSSSNRCAAVLNESVRIKTIEACLKEQPLDEDWEFETEQIERVKNVICEVIDLDSSDEDGNIS